MARSRVGWFAGFWLMVCAGLAAVVTYQLFTTFPFAPTVTAAPPAAPMLELAVPPDAPRLPGDAAVEEIAARPLFSAGRRPYRARPPDPDQPILEPTRPSLPLELAGVFLTDTDRAALLQLAGKSPEWLRTGQRIDGWQIEQIKRDQVQLRKGDQEQVLLLRADLALPVRPSARTLVPRADPPDREVAEEDERPDAEVAAEDEMPDEQLAEEETGE